MVDVELSLVVFWGGMGLSAAFNIPLGLDALSDMGCTWLELSPSFWQGGEKAPRCAHRQLSRFRWRFNRRRLEGEGKAW